MYVQHRISTKGINDVSQLCKGAFQSACYLDTPNVYIVREHLFLSTISNHFQIQRQISDHLSSNDFNANAANVEIYRRMNNATEKWVITPETSYRLASFQNFDIGLWWTKGEEEWAYNGIINGSRSCRYFFRLQIISSFIFSNIGL